MPHVKNRDLLNVNRFLRLKFNSGKELQEIVGLLAEICQIPLAMISMLDQDTEYIKFKVGTAAKKWPVQDSFCQFLPQVSRVMVISDTAKDKRTARLRLVQQQGFRFYAGIALMTHDGMHVGSLCLIDYVPKEISSVQKKLIRILAKRVVEIMEFSYSLTALKAQSKEIRNSETTIKSLAEGDGNCHLLIGMKLDIIAFNKNIADFIKRIYHIELKQGLHVSEILKGKSLNQFKKEVKKALSGTIVSYEREVVYGEEAIWWAVTMQPGYDSAGKIIGISYNTADITEKKHYEQKIMAQNQQLMKIAHIQSHELRKPVANILGFVELFKHNDYTSTREELLILGRATQELDDKICAIVALTQ